MPALFPRRQTGGPEYQRAQTQAGVGANIAEDDDYDDDDDDDNDGAKPSAAAATTPADAGAPPAAAPMDVDTPGQPAQEDSDDDEDLEAQLEAELQADAEMAQPEASTQQAAPAPAPGPAPQAAAVAEGPAPAGPAPAAQGAAAQPQEGAAARRNELRVRLMYRDRDGDVVLRCRDLDLARGRRAGAPGLVYDTVIAGLKEPVKVAEASRTRAVLEHSYARALAGLGAREHAHDDVADEDAEQAVFFGGEKDPKSVAAMVREQGAARAVESAADALGHAYWAERRALAQTRARAMWEAVAGVARARGSDDERDGDGDGDDVRAVAGVHLRAWEDEVLSHVVRASGAAGGTGDFAREDGAVGSAAFTQNAPPTRAQRGGAVARWRGASIARQDATSSLRLEPSDVAAWAAKHAPAEARAPQAEEAGGDAGKKKKKRSQEAEERGVDFEALSLTTELPCSNEHLLGDAWAEGVARAIEDLSLLDATARVDPRDRHLVLQVKAKDLESELGKKVVKRLRAVVVSVPDDDTSTTADAIARELAPYRKMSNDDAYATASGLIRGFVHAKFAYAVNGPDIIRTTPSDHMCAFRPSYPIWQLPAPAVPAPQGGEVAVRVQLLGEHDDKAAIWNGPLDTTLHEMLSALREAEPRPMAVRAFDDHAVYSDACSLYVGRPDGLLGDPVPRSLHVTLADAGIPPTGGTLWVVVHFVAPVRTRLISEMPDPASNAPIRPPRAFEKYRNVDPSRSGWTGHVVLCEYLEQHPLLLTRPGMHSRLVTYYRRKDAKDFHGSRDLMRAARDGGPREVPGETPGDLKPMPALPPGGARWRVGEVHDLEHDAKDTEIPIMGATLPRGECLLTFQSSLYRAVAEPYDAQYSDFLLTRHIREDQNGGEGVLDLREISGTLLLGQQMPRAHIPQPGSAEHYVVTRAMMRRYVWSTFKAMKDPRDKESGFLVLRDVASVFNLHQEEGGVNGDSGHADWNYDVTEDLAEDMLVDRNSMQSFRVVGRGGRNEGGHRIIRLAPAQIIPEERELEDMCPPEMASRWLAMRLGDLRLRRLGMYTQRLQDLEPSYLKTLRRMLVKRRPDGALDNFEAQENGRTVLRNAGADDPSVKAAVDLLSEMAIRAPWRLAAAYIAARDISNKMPLVVDHEVGDPTGRGYALSFVEPERRLPTRSTGPRMKAGQLAEQGADYRKMSVAEIKQHLRSEGLEDSEIQGLGLKRWDLVELLRDIRTRKYEAGDLNMQQFAREWRQSSRQQKSAQTKKAHEIFRKQVAALKEVPQTAGLVLGGGDAGRTQSQSAGPSRGTAVTAAAKTGSRQLSRAAPAQGRKPGAKAAGGRGGVNKTPPAKKGGPAASGAQASGSKTAGNGSLTDQVAPPGSAPAGDSDVVAPPTAPGAPRPPATAEAAPAARDDEEEWAELTGARTAAGGQAKEAPRIRRRLRRTIYDAEGNVLREEIIANPNEIEAIKLICWGERKPHPKTGEVVISEPDTERAGLVRAMQRRKGRGGARAATGVPRPLLLGGGRGGRGRGRGGRGRGRGRGRKGGVRVVADDEEEEEDYGDEEEGVAVELEGRRAKRQKRVAAEARMAAMFEEDKTIDQQIELEGLRASQPKTGPKRDPVEVAQQRFRVAVVGPRGGRGIGFLPTLRTYQRAELFAGTVFMNDVLEEYTNVVGPREEWMYLDRIQEKAEALEYETVEQLLQDVQKIYDNVFKYHDEETGRGVTLKAPWVVDAAQGFVDFARKVASEGDVAQKLHDAEAAIVNARRRVLEAQNAPPPEEVGDEQYVEEEPAAAQGVALKCTACGKVRIVAEADAGAFAEEGGEKFTCAGGQRDCAQPCDVPCEGGCDWTPYGMEGGQGGSDDDAEAGSDSEASVETGDDGSDEDATSDEDFEEEED
ncbi:unnamed protein product [Pedinophyceae sp. YPF-701]|nr:unnamed protein product [Pedinophyceae sp. YPF-701]